LKSRAKKELKPQKQLLFRYDIGDPRRPLRGLPDDTKITPQGGAMAVFGLMQVEATWKEFRQAGRMDPLGHFWCNTLVHMVLVVAGAPELYVHNRQLIAGNDPQDLYRLILTTVTSYYNNQIDVSVYLVHYSQRTDYEDLRTSLLLKALQLVCRYRFLLLE